jgi:hypothetical protein
MGAGYGLSGDVSIRAQEERGEESRESREGKRNRRESGEDGLQLRSGKGSAALLRHVRRATSDHDSY